MESSRDFRTDAEWAAYELGVEDGLADLDERVEDRVREMGRRSYEGRGRETRSRVPVQCYVDGCDRDAHAKGMCSKHYARNRDYGDPLHPYIARPERMKCMVPNCDRGIRHLGMCRPHYDGFLRARADHDEDAYLIDIFGGSRGSQLSN
jgi:hypothetical protein